jgi:BASS family bile acid:Na+ symporter
MLQTINKRLEKLMPLITPASVILGILLSSWLDSYAYLVPWIFAFLTFSGSLGSNFSDLRSVLKQPFPMIVCLVILHILMPLIALGVGKLLFYNDPYTVTGLILAFSIPTGIMSLLWVSMYKGNVVLTLSIILTGTFLSPLIVPLSMKFFVGTAVAIDLMEMMEGLLWMIVLPSILGMLVNQITRGEAQKQLGPTLSPFSKIGLGVVIAINSSVVAPYFKDINGKLVFITVVVFVLAATGYLIGWQVAKFLKCETNTIVSLSYNSGMRNISAGAVIAVAYFPTAVAVPVIVGMLFQQILASIYGILLNKFYYSAKKFKKNCIPAEES